MKPIFNNPHIKKPQTVSNQPVANNAPDKKSAAVSAHISGKFAALLNSYQATQVQQVTTDLTPDQKTVQKELDLIGQLAYAHMLIKKLTDSNLDPSEKALLQQQLQQVLQKASTYGNQLGDDKNAKSYLDMLQEMQGASTTDDYAKVQKDWTSANGVASQIFNWYNDNSSAISAILSQDPANSDLMNNSTYLDSVAGLFFIFSSEYNNPTYSSAQDLFDNSIFSQPSFNIQIGQFMAYYFYHENGSSMTKSSEALKALGDVMDRHRDKDQPVTPYDDIVTLIQHTYEETKSFGNNWPSPEQKKELNTKGAGWPVWTMNNSDLSYNFFFLGNVFKNFFGK